MFRSCGLERILRCISQVWNMFDLQRNYNASTNASLHPAWSLEYWNNLEHIQHQNCTEFPTWSKDSKAEPDFRNPTDDSSIHYLSFKHFWRSITFSVVPYRQVARIDLLKNMSPIASGRLRLKDPPPQALQPSLHMTLFTFSKTHQTKSVSIYWKLTGQHSILESM
jgi:hypothetical protein